VLTLVNHATSFNERHNSRLPFAGLRQTTRHAARSVGVAECERACPRPSQLCLMPLGASVLRCCAALPRPPISTSGPTSDLVELPTGSLTLGE